MHPAALNKVAHVYMTLTYVRYLGTVPYSFLCVDSSLLFRSVSLSLSLPPPLGQLSVIFTH